MQGLLTFQVATVVRGPWALVGTAVFAGAAIVVTVLGLDSFRQVGLGAVGPAAVALVNLALLLPTAQAVLLGAQQMTAERETGFLAAIAARGAGRGAIVVCVWLAVTAATWLALLSGFGAAALILAGNVPIDDLPAFAGVVAATLLVAAAAAAVGVLIGAAVANRLRAMLVGLAAWFMLAVGLDVLVVGLGVFLRVGELGLLAAVAANPFEAGRMAALLAIDARGAVLGPVGTFLLGRLGPEGTLALLGGIVVAWTALPIVAARQVLRWRDL
jgi:ABC-type transport system involved in multi-copper enzyme maturation permease subunit